MSGTPVEVADIIRRHGAELLETHGATISADQRRVLKAIASCRTAALGGHIAACDRCGQRQVAYNSCRNRHCPKCQAAARAQWLDERSAELLPVPYYHVVFTLPESVAALALQNQRALYGLLFRTATDTLREVAVNPERLGAQIGGLAVLHTWGQNLSHHPHVHCVIPGGGFSPDGASWVACRESFFLPVRVLSRVFRGKFIAGLRRARQKGQLRFLGTQAALTDDATFERWLDDSVRTEWVVYAKAPFGGPDQVLKYLARYTHRVAISNQRLVSCQNGQVTFRWKDYADGQAQKTMTVTAVEFLRRFLMHVLPRGFVKIRHFGFLANRHREANLQRARTLLNVSPASAPIAAPPPFQAEPTLPQQARCTACGQGLMCEIERLPRVWVQVPLAVWLTNPARDFTCSPANNSS
jgi:hypothetical protein